MKRLFPLIISALILLCSCQSNINNNNSSDSSFASVESTVSVVEIESEPAVGSMPESSVASEVKAKPLSYEEYFSQAREFKNDSLPNEYKNYAYFINSKEFDPFFYKEGKGENYILREKIGSNEVEVVLAKSVSSMYCTGNDLVCIVNNNQIVQIDMEGGNETLLYEDTNPISNICANSDLIFFVKDKTINRIYRPTQTVDRVYQNDDLVDYEPISNVEIKWRKNNPKWIDNYNRTHNDSTNIQRYITSYFNVLTGEERVMPSTYGD